MIEWAVDAHLYILLLAAIGFGWIGVIGLLLFPDIRSRAFTGLRAGIIAVTLVTAAAICYGIFTWITNGGMQYLLLVLAAILILFIVVILNRIAAKTICHNAVPVPSHPGEKKDQS